MEGLVDEAGTGGGVAQHAQAAANFLIVGASDGAVGDGHGPDGVNALVRTAHPFAGFAVDAISVTFLFRPLFASGLSAFP